MSIDRDHGPMTGTTGRRARCRARLGRPDLDPDLLAARLPDRLRSAAARLSPAARARAWCGPASEPQHDPGGLSSFVRRRLRHESPRRRHPRRRAAAAATRRGGAGRASSPRCCDAPPTPGFTADELAAATFAAATERKRPGPLVRVLFAECTNADAGYDAERLVRRVPGASIEVEGALLDDLPDRLERFHYDLVATTTFHADEAQALVAGRVPVVAMIVGPGLRRARPRDRRRCRPARKVGLVCASGRGSDNIRETLALSGTTRRRDRLGAHRRPRGPRRCVDRDRRRHPACRARRWRPGSTATFSRPERIRPWTYDFDPSGLELLRRAIEHVAEPAGRG